MTQATNWSVPLVGPATPTVMAQRTDDSFDALLSGHSGSARPTYAAAGTIWEDTSVAGETRLWFYDGSQDILVAVVDTVNDRVDLAPQPLVDVASAATTDIGAIKSRNIRITGTATITSFGTIRAGTTKTVYFAAALTVTYNATSLITPTGSSLSVAPGDSIELVSLGSGNWLVLQHVTNSKVTPWVAYTPTFNGIGTATGIKCRSRRIGSNLEVEAAFTTGTVTATTFDMSLGFNGVNGGIVCDTFWNGSRPVLGVVVYQVAGPSALYVLGLGNSNVVNISISATSRDGVTPVAGTVLGTGTPMLARFSVPIDGWN